MTTAKRTEDDYGNRHYQYPPTGEPVVSVTTVNGATEGKPWLPPWASGITAGWSVDNLQLLARTLETEGRDAAVKLAKQQGEIIRDLKRDAGGYVHDVIEALTLWAASPEGLGADIVLPTLPDHLVNADYDDDPLPDVVDWMITGFLNFVADFQPEFQAAEMTVFNMDLGYAGTLDSIIGLTGYAINEAERFDAAPGNRLSLCVDAKTGKHLSVTWREQVAAYRHAREALMPLGDLAPLPPTDAGCVLHLRPEHERGYRLMLVSDENDMKAWATFRNSLSMYLDRADARPKPGKVVYPLRPDGTMPQPRVRDLDGEGYGRAISPLVKAGIGDLEQLAAMTPGQLLATKGVGPATVGIVRGMLADHGLHLYGEATPAAKAA
jgi:hypothetical protein